MMKLAQAAFLLLSTTSLFSISNAASLSLRPRASVCNGHAELCSRTFGNVTYVGAHDSYAVQQGNIASNQDYDITTQLNEGIRMLQVQAHNTDNGIHLCHTSCILLDAGPFTTYLSTVKKWLDANPNEVISILIVNIDNLAATAFASAYEAAGLDTLSFTPSAASLGSDAWPTLGSMIDQNKRVVSFLDNTADFASVPYLIDEFASVWETAYNVVDQTFNCEVNRTGTADNKMYLINHFLDKYQTILGTSYPVPNKELLNVTNGVSGTGSLGLQADECAGIYKKYPTFMLVDYYNYGGGSVFQVAATLNGVTYDASKSISPPITATGSATSSGASSTSTTKSNGAEKVAHLASYAPTAMLIGVIGALLGGTATLY